jgi:glycosyltransferase involved in cell wall biosynthesis
MTRTHGDNGHNRPLVRVVHVGPDIDSFGGTQTVIRVLSDHCVGADAVAVLPTWCGSSQRRNAQLTARAGRAILRARGPKILHFHISNGGGWLREGPLLVLAKRRGFRVVATIHGYDFVEFARAHRQFVRAVLSHADRVLCLSVDARDEVVDLLGEATRVSTITNPVAIDFDAPTPGSVPPVVLFAGSIGLRKGVDVLIDAWRQILDQGIEGRCRIVGPITDFTPPSMRGLSVEPAVAPQDMQQLLYAARVVVLPSRAEAMPMILTEALATGRPFVATRVSGIPSITPDPSMLVPPENADALAKAISRYLVDPDAADTAGRLGREYVASTRSPEVVGAELRRIYTSLSEPRIAPNGSPGD